MKKQKPDGEKPQTEPPLGEPFRHLITDTPPPMRRRARLIARLRSYFFTGLVIAAPISITIYVTWWFIGFIDNWFKPLIPARYNPDLYLPFSVPGIGLLLALFMLTVLGALAANLFGRTVVGYGEQLLNRMPVVRNLYSALKQIFETVISQSNSTFRDVALIEYPRRGIYAIAFVSTDTKGEILDKVGAEDGMVSVFLPTTPNPTSGFLLFVPKSDVRILDMTVEEGAKLVISAGLVTPERVKAAEAVAAEKRDKLVSPDTQSST
ncbi:Uncharacterized membrane anchored protein Mext_4159 [hydrothermal vent metagenome]|uniref:Uncharacterized membrane anchored protein Mext_4159 n=1 Tax=hydrothermal vent metagenome TaxID=652676 RepID=A0A3B0T858_9ZZZZ